MITRRRAIGQWLAFLAIALLVVAAVYVIVAGLAVASQGCACTQAPEPAAVTPSG